MKLKLVIGKLTPSGEFRPLKFNEYDTDLTDALEVLNTIRSFFVDAVDIPMGVDMEHLMQGETAWTSSTLKAIKYYLKRTGLDFYYYMQQDELDDSEGIMNDLTRNSGVIMLDNDNKYLGFIPRGYFLRFNSQDDINPGTIMNWVGSQLRLFPGVSTDYFNNSLQSAITMQRSIGAVPAPMMATMYGILGEFDKQLIMI